MRTTIRLKPELARRAKALAKKTDRTFTELMEDAVSDLLEKSNGSPAKLPEIPVVTGTTSYTTAGLKKMIQQQEFEHDMRRIGRKV
jgi:hypothetical protein